MKIIIFDLDGTLANCDHRRGYIRSKPNNWKAFFAGIPDDKPYFAVVDMCQIYLEANPDAVYFVSGRPDDTRAATIDWLDSHVIDTSHLKYREVDDWGDEVEPDEPTTWIDKHLRMRKAGDFRPDYVVKREILQELRAEGLDVIAVVDDRPDVIKMWKEEGVFVFEVNQEQWEDA